MGCSYRDRIVWQKATTLVTEIIVPHKVPSRGNVRLDQPAETISRVRRE
jgi:hypothetical protein